MKRRSFLRTVLIPVLLSLAVAVLFLVLTLYPPTFIQFLEAKIYDWKFQLRGARDTGGQIVIVGIDEKSIRAVGRWPWPRDRQAELIRKIGQTKPSILGIDIFYSEPQIDRGSAILSELRRTYEKTESRNEEFLRLLGRKEQSVDVDRTLAAAIKSVDRSVLAFLFLDTVQGRKVASEELPWQILESSFFATQQNPYYPGLQAHRVVAPMEQFVESATAIGHTTLPYVKDGILRWALLSLGYRKNYYPHFCLEIARLHKGIEKEKVKLFIGEGIALADEYIETDEEGKILINYAGPGGTYPTYSAADVLDGKVAGKELGGKLVFLSTTAQGTFDTHITPYSYMPGVEVNANILENILRRNFLQRVESQVLLSIGVILVFSLLLGLLLPHMKAVSGGVFSLVLGLICFGGSYYAFIAKGLWIDFVTPVGSVFFTYATLISYKYMAEERKAKEIRSIFSSYVTEKVVNQLMLDPEMAKLGGEKKEITVLFSDIRGFTSLSEKLSPEEVVELLNEYLSSMVDVVFRWEGTLDKFIGDAVMAFWGAPLDQPDHAERAVSCGLEMLAELRQLQQKWAREGQTGLSIGIGINTGEVVVGNMGAEGKKMDYTIIGDHVNLGSRVEGLTRKYETDLIITEYTYQKIRPAIETGKFPGLVVRELEAVKVKGKEQQVLVYALSMKDE